MENEKSRYVFTALKASLSNHLNVFLFMLFQKMKLINIDKGKSNLMIQALSNFNIQNKIKRIIQVIRVKY